MTELRAIAAMRFGDAGDYIVNDENGRKIVRVSTGVNTLPDCTMFQNGKYVGTDIVWDAVDFLFQ